MGYHPTRRIGAAVVRPNAQSRRLDDVTKRLSFSLPPFEVGQNDQYKWDFSTLNQDELSALLDSARAETEEYGELGIDDLDDTDAENMRHLAALIPAARATMKRRNSAGGAYAALQKQFASDPQPEAGEETEDAAEAGDADVAGDPPTPPKAPVAKPTPKRVGVADAVQAGAGTPAEEIPQEPLSPAKLVASVGVPGYAGGAEIDWVDVGRIVEQRFRGYGASGQSGQGRRDTVAQIRVDYPDELTASGGDLEDATGVLKHASNERRLPGGSLLASLELDRKRRASQPTSNSLTAAGIGWCAPSQVRYNLYELESTDGMLDLPEINVTRGGIKYTAGPDFSSIYNGAGYFHMTEAQIIAGTTKPTMPVPCPSFTDTRLDADGLAIQADLLQLRGYPELIARFVRGAMVAHEHKINQFMINALVTGSTAMPLPSNNASHTPGLGTTWVTDHSVVSNLLSAVDLAITDYKYRQRMTYGSTLEVIFPMWLQGLIRSDVQRRTFYDGDDGVDQFAVTMDNIQRWLSVRGARAQWIYDWQDAFYWAAFPSGAPSAWQRMGNDPTTVDYVQDWPHGVQFLVYAAGTWTRGNADIITLDTVYDSTLLSANKVTQLFTEQGILAAKTGFDSRLYSINNIIPTGSGTYAPVALTPATTTTVFFPTNP